MAAFNFDGKVVSVNDQVTIEGEVVSVSGTAQPLTVTVLPFLTPSTFNAAANDMQAVEHQNDAVHPAVSISGKHFGEAGNRVSVLGRVSSISGSGNGALLTVILKTSGLSITVPAGSVRSAQFNG